MLAHWHKTRGVEGWGEGRGRAHAVVYDRQGYILKTENLLCIMIGDEGPVHFADAQLEGVPDEGKVKPKFGCKNRGEHLRKQLRIMS